MSGTRPDLPAAQALEQLSNEEFWSYAHELAYLAPTVPLASEQYLLYERRDTRYTFNNHPSAYLIPLTALHEVLPMPHNAHKPALFPNVPAWMIGVIAWHGETVAVVDLDAYLSSTIPENDPASISTSVILIAQCSGPPIALLVPSITPSTQSSEAPILDLCTILQDVEQQIKDTCPP
jgi:chemotaxis signal transduction protein